MENVPVHIVEQFIEAGRKIADMGLVRFSSGNHSLRVGPDRLIIKTMGSRMGSLTPGQVSLCSIGQKRSLDGKTPSKELGFHAGIMSARGEVGAVLHFQSTYATAVSCMKGPLPSFDLVPEIPHFIGAPALVEYLTPGSPELAAAVVEASMGHDMVILRNHGLVTAGKDLDDVILKAGYFEMACEILLHVENPGHIP